MGLFEKKDKNKKDNKKSEPKKKASVEPSDEFKKKFLFKKK